MELRLLTGMLGYVLDFLQGAQYTNHIVLGVKSAMRSPSPTNSAGEFRSSLAWQVQRCENGNGYTSRRIYSNPRALVPFITAVPCTRPILLRLPTHHIFPTRPSLTITTPPQLYILFFLLHLPHPLPYPTKSIFPHYTQHVHPTLHPAPLLPAHRLVRPTPLPSRTTASRARAVRNAAHGATDGGSARVSGTCKGYGDGGAEVVFCGWHVGGEGEGEVWGA